MTGVKKLTTIIQHRRFSGDESFLHVPSTTADQKNTTVAVTDDETRLDDAVLLHGNAANARKGSASRL